MEETIPMRGVMEEFGLITSVGERVVTYPSSLERPLKRCHVCEEEESKDGSENQCRAMIV